MTYDELLESNKNLDKRKPNPNCKDCWGKGTLIYFTLNGVRKERPCHCLKIRK